jgi:hypothetical protein
MIALTITTCRRLGLFKTTIRSFVEKCLDLEIFDVVMHYDDNSSAEDRVEMVRIFDELFPDKVIIHKHFGPKSIPGKKRHMGIMNEWKKDVETGGIDYVFHVEDDFDFIKKFKVRPAISLLSSSPDIAYVAYSQPIRNFPNGYHVDIMGSFWQWFYDKDKPLCDKLFLDTVEMSNHSHPNFWCYYINWPYFSTRPGVHDVSKLKKLAPFRDSDMSFELEFAIRYSKLYKSFSHVDRICNHIGVGESAYSLNSSNR